MNRLRTFGKLGLLAGMFAVLVSCANFKGDLGADLDNAPVLASKGPAKSLLDVTSPADLAAETVEVAADIVDLKDPRLAQPQSVSANKVTTIPSIASKETKTVPPPADTKVAEARPVTPPNDVAPIELKEVTKDEKKSEPVKLTPVDKPVVIADEKKDADEAARAELDKLVAAKVAAAKEEVAKLAAARAEAEKILAEKATAEKTESARVEAEKVAAAKREAELKAETEKVAAAKIEAERVEKEKIEAAKVAAAKAEAERIEAEKVAAAKREAEVKAEAEKVAAAKAEAERVEKEKIEAAKVAAAKAEAERIEAEKVAAAMREAELKAEAEKVAAAKIEAERVEAEKVAAAKREAEMKAEAEKVAAAKAEAERVEKEKIEAAKVAAAKAEAERIEAEKVVAAKREAEVKAEAEKVAAAKIEAERVEKEKIEAAKVAAAKAEAERIEAEKVAAAKREADMKAKALAAVEMKIYDVSDLTKTVQDYASPQFRELTAEEKAAAAALAKSARTLASMSDMIRLKVSPEAWDPQLGTSIEERGGRLVVMQRPEIHEQINKLLTDLRAANVAAKPVTNAYVAVAGDDKKPGDPPTVPPVPVPTTPKEETPEERAARLLKEGASVSSVQTQASRADAEAKYQAGMRAFNDWEYETALKYFEAAVAIDPTHKDADEKRKICRSLLNIDVNSVAMKIRALEDSKRVEMQEQMISLAHAIEEARSYEVRGSETVLDTANDMKTRGLADRLRLLEQAQERYRRVVEVIDWMPPNIELPDLRKTAQESLSRVRGKIEKIQDEVSQISRREALDRAAAAKTRESEQFKMRITKLLDQVKALYDVQDYRGAEQMAVRILTLDPLNIQAESWKKKARAAGHKLADENYKTDYREEYRSAMQDVDEAIISTDAIITYPSNWDQIIKRQDVTFGKKVSEDAWKSDLKKKLQKKVSFEFVDTPLAEAVEFLRHFANVTMIIDPKVLAANPPAINLRVTDMNLDLALEWILKLAELEYAYQDQAIFISKAQNLVASVEMKIYDVSDLTQKIQDFPGPELQVDVAGPKAGAGGGGAANPFLQAPAGNTPTNQTISDMIRTRVRPETWAAEQGTSIEERGGRLVVMQRPEIHTLIDKLLSNFRSTQKMMINIESRFLNIREAYLEEVGVEYQGLDPNVLFGDFGDLRRLGAPTGFIQPRVPGSTDTSPGNLPFPGVVNGPDRVNGGTFSQVGSLINHAINFNPNDPETISAQDPNSVVRNGGLSAQVTVLNNTQVQAFIRALAVRENTSTLIAPRLTVFNTQRANMFVARQQSYVADYEISGDSYDPVVRQFLVGVVLDVKPIVSSDRRYVTLELRPTVTELVNFVTRQIDTFSVNSGAQVNVLVFLSFPIQFPELSIRRVRTTATVPDGGIMLVGGLYRNTKFNAENGVPFLSDLPVVGRLFRWNTVDNSKSNLAILVSPRIILFNEEEEKLLH